MTVLPIKVSDPATLKALGSMLTQQQNVAKFLPGPSSAPGEESTSTIVVEKPAAALKYAGNKFNELYEQYSVLRELARPLNGLAQGNVLPDNVQIASVTLNFSVNSVDYSTTLDTVRGIGEVSQMLSVALRTLIERMHQELALITHVALGVQQSIQQALNASNPSTPEIKEDEKAIQPNADSPPAQEVVPST